MARSNCDIIGTGYGSVGVFVEAWETANNGTYSTVHVQAGMYYSASSGHYATSSAYINLSGRGNREAAHNMSAGYEEVLDSYDTNVNHDGNGNGVNVSFSCYGYSYYLGGSGTATVTISTSSNPRYSVSYNGDGGSNVPGNQTKVYGINLGLSGTTPTKNLYNFVNWSGSDGGTYSPGSAFGGNYNLTLTAIWELAYVAPTISNIYAYHTTVGTDDKVKVGVVWSVDRSINGGNSGSGIAVWYKQTTSGSWIQSSTVSISGQSATTEFILDPALNVDITYDIQVRVYDTYMGYNYGTTRTTIATGAKYPIDISTSGHVGINGAAEDGYIFCVKGPTGTVVLGVDKNGGFYHA